MRQDLRTNFELPMSRYKERWGDMNVPRRFWEDWALGIWVTDLRAASRQQWLNPTQARCLREIDFPITVSGVSEPVVRDAHTFH